MTARNEGDRDGLEGRVGHLDTRKARFYGLVRAHTPGPAVGGNTALPVALTGAHTKARGLLRRGAPGSGAAKEVEVGGVSVHSAPDGCETPTRSVRARATLGESVQD